MINQIRIREKLPASKRITGGTHAGLWLDKYMKGQSRGDSDNRGPLVEEVAELPEPAAYQAYLDRWREMLTTYNAQTRRVRVKGRMVVGMGNESVLETSICLHHTYGVPYIPGSALKGLAASYAHHYLSDEWQRGGMFHNAIFGQTDNAGYITFFDALYLPGTGHDGRPLTPDVITVHHPKYYQSENATPSESDSPTPIPFLSATGTYLFALAAPDFQQPTRWIDLTFQILAEALEKLGVGAKTSSGYGRMKFIDPPIRPLDPEIRVAEGYKRELDALKDVAGQVPGYYQKWQQLVSQEARKILARAIIEKVRQAGREKVTAEKAWYKEIQAYLVEE